MITSIKIIRVLKNILNLQGSAAVGAANSPAGGEAATFRAAPPAGPRAQCLWCGDADTDGHQCRRYCGNIRPSQAANYACTKPHGHQGQHGYAGMVWPQRNEPVVAADDQLAAICEVLGAHIFHWPDASSIGSAAHCSCGERPVGQWQWREHVSPLIAARLPSAATQHSSSATPRAEERPATDPPAVAGPPNHPIKNLAPHQAN